MRNKRVTRDIKQGTLNDGTRPNEVIDMHFIGPVDDQYLLMTIDFMSRRVQVDVCKRTDGDTVVRGLQFWVRKCGPIHRLVTDQGRQFTGEQVRLWCARGGVERIWTHAYDHRSNGLVERCNIDILLLSWKY